jgi:immunity protein 7 of polymorphic toxin system
MFEYHEWAVIRDATNDGDETRLARMAEDVRRGIGEFAVGSGVADVRWVNGTCMVWFAGCPNHRYDRVLDLLPWLGRLAPGSYGLLYVWDDEDLDAENRFRVWRLARGQVEERTDPFFSPCIPTIEDKPVA